MQHWKYMNDNGQIVCIAEKGRNDKPWRICCYAVWKGHISPKLITHYGFRQQFADPESAQHFLDDYADDRGWRLFSREYEEILKKARKGKHARTLLREARNKKIHLVITERRVA